MGAGSATILAYELPDKGALTELNISSNYIGAAQGEDPQRICATGGIELVKSRVK
jgi:hypothetical protein